jgi:NADPH:quinone reductase-like Zn-dependent oxidoreductase
MRAAFYEAFGEPATLLIGDMPDPEPGGQDVVIRTHAAGVGMWDVKMMRGRFGTRTFPMVPGFEVAGVVERAGPRAGVAEGDRVYASLQPKGGGGFAERSLSTVETLAPMPEGHDFAEMAALVVSAGTAYEGLVDRASVQAGEAVLITAAAGGVGSAAVQIAHHRGARVVAVAGAGSHEYLRALGADAVVDYRDPGYVEHLRDEAPDGYDLLLDGTGNEVRDRVVELLRPGGRGVFIVGPPGDVRTDIDAVYFSATITGERLRAINELVAADSLRMRIEAEYPLERAADAMAHVAKGHTRGRVILRAA